MPPITPHTTEDLITYMAAHRIAGEIRRCTGSTPTVEAAARELGVSPEQVAKSLIFLVGERPVLVIACGLEPVDRRPIAACFQVGRKQVKLASSETVLELTGYPAGTVPPFGYPRPLQTLIDRRILNRDVIYAGGGEENAMLRIMVTDLVKATQAEIIDLL